jgi:hypothetical protein
MASASGLSVVESPVDGSTCGTIRCGGRQVLIRIGARPSGGGLRRLECDPLLRQVLGSQWELVRARLSHPSRSGAEIAADLAELAERAHEQSHEGRGARPLAEPEVAFHGRIVAELNAL